MLGTDLSIKNDEEDIIEMTSCDENETAKRIAKVENYGSSQLSGTKSKSGGYIGIIDTTKDEDAGNTGGGRNKGKGKGVGGNDDKESGDSVEESSLGNIDSCNSNDISLPLSSISSLQSQYDFIPTEAVMNLVLPSASVSARNNGMMGKVARFGHHNSARFDFFITLFFHALLGLLSLLWVRPTCSILKEKKKKNSKWVKMHGSRLFLAFAAILILVSTPTCIKAESGGDAEAPLAEMPDALKTLTKLSHDIHLRGSDPEVTMTTTKNILQKHIESIEALQRMYQNGDNDGLASVVETILSEKKTLELAISQTKGITGDDPFGGEDVPLDSIVEEITRGDIEIDFVEAFRQSDFNSMVDDMKHISELLNNVDLSLFSHSHSHSHRRMTNLFEQDGGSSSRSHDSIFLKKQKSQFTTNTFSHYAKLFENTGNIFRSGSGRGKASHNPLPHFHRMHGNADDRDRAARKLRVSDRNTRRRLAVEECTAPCSIDDATCNCRRLYDCLKELSTYDLAVLTLRGYIVLDGRGIGDITNDSVDVFDLGDGGLTKRFDFFKGRASMADPENQEQCTRVLEELHSSCSPTEVSCSDTNDQAYQLSVDEVCDAVDTNVKLNLGTIFDVFSTKPNCLKITTSTTPCLEVDPSDGYRIKSATCDATNAYQQFYHTHPYVYSEEVQIKVTAEPSLCLDQRTDGITELYMGQCHDGDNQRWIYNSETESLRSVHDGACVDYNYVSNYLTHQTCHGQNNQKFSPIGNEPGLFLPSKWNSNGYLKAYVDFGYGYELVADSSFHYGEVVVDDCYPAILGVKVSQGDQTGSTWIGNLEVSNDDRETFLPMKCIGGCTCDEMEGCSPLMPVAVDGDFDAINGVANVYCLGTMDRNCTFAPDLAAEENSKESTPMPYDRFMI